MLVDIDLKFYSVPSRPTWVTLRSRSRIFLLKFLVKVLSLYLLNVSLDQVDNLHVDRYWSEVLCCTIMTHLGDLEVKVTDLTNFVLKFLVKFFVSLYLLNVYLDQVDT